MKKILILIIILIHCFVSAAQTAWLRDKHEWYIAFGQQYMQSDSYYSIAGDLVITTPFYNGISSLYAEYGINKYQTLITSVPFLKFQGYTSTNTVFGLGDISIALKTGVFQKILPLAYTIEVELPTGNAELKAFNQANLVEFINLPTGDGEINFHNKLALSKSFHPANFYASITGDYNIRTSYNTIDFHNQFIGSFEMGFSSGAKNWLIFKSNFLATLGEVTEFTDFSRGEGSAYSFYQIEYIAQISKSLFINTKLGVFGDIPVQRKNIYSAPVFNIGIAYKGKLSL